MVAYMSPVVSSTTTVEICDDAAETPSPEAMPEQTVVEEEPAPPGIFLIASPSATYTSPFAVT